MSGMQAVYCKPCDYSSFPFFLSADLDQGPIGFCLLVSLGFSDTLHYSKIMILSEVSRFGAYVQKISALVVV